MNSLEILGSPEIQETTVKMENQDFSKRCSLTIISTENKTKNVGAEDRTAVVLGKNYNGFIVYRITKK